MGTTTEQRLSAQLAVAHILAESEALAQAAPRLLEAVCRNLDWTVGLFWQIDQAGERTRYVASWSQGSAREFIAASRQFQFKLGEGLPGRVWAQKAPGWIRDVTQDNNFPRLQLAAREGLHTGVAFPILLADEVLGVMEFFSPTVREFDQELLPVLAALGQQIGQFIERKRIETELRHNEQRLRTLVGSIDEIVFEFDEAGTYLNIWTEDETLLVRPKRELLGRRDTEFLAEPFTRPFHEVYQRVLQTGQAETLEYYLDVQGGRRCFLARINPITSADGNRRTVCVLARDITERKQQEEALHHSERRFRTLVEQSPLSIQLFAPNGDCIHANQAWQQLWKTTLDQVAGYNILQDEQLRAQGIMPQIEAAFTGQAVEIAPLLYDPAAIGKPGRRRWVEAFLYPVKDDENNLREVALVLEDVTARLEAEESLRDTNQTLAALIQASPLAIMVLDPTGLVRGWNPAAERIFGWSAAEVLGRFLPAVPEDKRAEFQANLKTTLATNSTMGINGLETRRQKRGGLPLDVAFWSAPLRDNHGQPYAVVSLVADITERKRAEEQQRFLAEASDLLASSMDYETTLKNLAQLAVPHLGDWCAIDLLDAAQQLKRVAVVHADPAKVELSYELMRRYPPQPAAAYGLTKVLQTGNSELASDLSPVDLAQFARDAEHLRMLQTMNLKSYMLVPLAARGRILGTLSFAISESAHHYNETDLAFAEELARRAAIAIDNARLYWEVQQALQAREQALTLHHTVEERLTMLARASGALIGSLKLNTVILAIRDLSRQLVAADAYAIWRYQEATNEWQIMSASGLSEGYQKTTIVVTDSIPGTIEQPVIVEQITNEPLLDERQSLLRQEGICSLLALPLKIQGLNTGSITFYFRQPHSFSETEIKVATALANLAAAAISTVELYDEQRRLRTEAETANRLKDEFLATVSHELRTPLNAILGWARLLRTGRVTGNDFNQALETIERNARAQAQIINDILDVSRIITGKLTLEISSVELVPVIEAAIATVRPAIEAKSIELETVLDPLVGPVAGDVGRLQQIIWNLLSNAVKFTATEGKIVVRYDRIIAPDGAQARIIVTDTGQGISREFLPYVFERFRQEDGSITRTHGGLGLGLAIVRYLVELHGGTVYAESPGENAGATFTVYLPLKPVPSEASHPANLVRPTDAAVTSGLTISLQHLTVLVVDDEADSRDLIATILGEAGAQVQLCGSTAEALAALKRSQPDILISDLAMPGEDGYSLIRRVRTMKTGHHHALPAIALTAYARDEDRARSLAAGFQVHLTKPLEPAELLAAVAELAQRKGQV